MRPSGYFVRADDLVGIFKAQADVVDFAITWADHLPAGVTLSSAVWTVPAGITGSTEALESPIAKKRIGGGAVGADYPITCTITKSNGEIVARTFVVTVVDALS